MCVLEGMGGWEEARAHQGGVGHNINVEGGTRLFRMCSGYQSLMGWETHVETYDFGVHRRPV